ncbi:UvrD-helicase domain-containing protein [Candidatus Peregrinibacteria bacterium]|nr:UvrD-helicase domain-containing protein [Candidatus Peregrinibacteria bacterium]
MYKDLNEAQKMAVEHRGNLLIIAGPGTGKTHTLTHKIAHTLLRNKNFHCSDSDSNILRPSSGTSEKYHFENETQSKSVFLKIPSAISHSDISNTRIFEPSILALTFTKKASDEMKQRLISLLADCQHTNKRYSDCRNTDERYAHAQHADVQIIDVQNTDVQHAYDRHTDVYNLSIDHQIFIGTFHSWCLEMLKKFSRDFVLYGEKEKMIVLQKIASSTFPNWTKTHINDVARLISLHKNQLLPIEKIAEKIPLPDFLKTTEYITIAHLYEKKMSAFRALDFDDLLVKTLELFTHPSPEIDAYRKNMRYVFIDEYQDVNTVQYELIRLLMHSNVAKTTVTDEVAISNKSFSTDTFQSTSKTICAIGDPDQSIYAFRGSNIDYFFRFSEDFPHATTLRLEENYRSSSFIIKASESLIAYNSKRIHRSLRPQFEDSTLVSVISANDGWKEAYGVTKKIQKLVGGLDMIESGHAHYHVPSETFRFSDIAVLYRTKAQGRLIEASIKKAGIPCQMVPESAWYLKKEIQTLLHYLRLLVYPHDDSSLSKILQTASARQKKNTSLFLTQIQALMDEMIHFTPTECAQKIWNDFGFESYYCRKKNGGNVHAKIRAKTLNNEKIVSDEKIQNNFLLFLSTSAQFDSMKGKEGLLKLLEHYTFLQNEDTFDSSVEAVHLMTLHASKGLEFPVVFITGLEDGLLPYSTKSENSARFSKKDDFIKNQLEEERRLFYVGITRAKRKLYLLHALVRDEKETTPSPFLKEIREELLERKTLRKPLKNIVSSQNFHTSKWNDHDQSCSDQKTKKDQLELFS